MNTLLAVDGSDNSYEAVRALKYFRRADKLTLLHVVNVPRPAYPMMMPEVADELYATVEKSMKEDGQRLLDRIESLLPADAGPVTKQLEVGSPSEVIVTQAEHGKADLILMGARGMGPIKERLLGSVSHRVLTLATSPTMILTGPLKTLHQILVPLQGPFDADAAVRFFGMKPFRNPVELTLMTVLPQTSPPWPVDAATAASMEKQGLQSAHDFLDGIAAKLAPLGYKTRSLATLGPPANMILHEAEKLRPDMIIMGTHGRRGITRFALGSVSHAVLHAAAYPVLVFR